MRVISLMFESSRVGGHEASGLILSLNAPLDVFWRAQGVNDCLVCVNGAVLLAPGDTGAASAWRSTCLMRCLAIIRFGLAWKEVNHCSRNEVKRIRPMWRRNWGERDKAVMMKAVRIDVSELIYKTAEGGSLNTNNLSSGCVSGKWGGENFVQIHLFSLMNAGCGFFRHIFRGAEILWANKHSLLQASLLLSSVGMNVWRAYNNDDL